MTSSATGNGTGESYYAHDRYEVARLVPAGARRILDVGCASGRLGRLLKSMRPDVEVRGIEPNEAAAAEAAEVLDAVRVGRAEDPLPAGWPVPDCVIFADVLEHLADPWKTLQHVHDQAARGAALVVSLPNVTHWSVRRELAAGRWRYRDEGLLDRTHLRFFDPPGAVALLEGAGYRIERLQRVVSQIPACPFTGLDPDRFRAVVDDRPPGRSWPTPRRWLMDLMTFQLLMVAR